MSHPLATPHLISLIDRISDKIGKTISWLALLMAVVQAMILSLLFLFNVGYLWLQESILYMNGTLFMIALGWTLKHDDHVRVDIFYRQKNIVQKAKINLVGILIFLLPLCFTMFWTSMPYAAHAWQILEGSRETGGLPALFILKTIIPISAALLALQSIAEALRAIHTIKKAPNPQTSPEI